MYKHALIKLVYMFVFKEDKKKKKKKKRKQGYLPHKAVVVECFDFTRVDYFPLKGSKPGSFWDGFLATEDAVMNDPGKRRGTDTKL